MIEDFRLRIFITVAEEGNFTKAASRLAISQPAVSQNISELERVTGVRLFERLRGEVKLTEAGCILKSHAMRILSAYTSASHLFSPMQPATVRVNASDEVYACLSDAFALFMAVHPVIQIVRSDAHECDLSFVLRPAPKAMGGISATHNVIASLYLFCQPSESFAGTELFESLKGFLADAIS